MEITKLLVFVLVWFVAPAREGIFISKTTDPRIVVEGLGVLVPMPPVWTVDMGLDKREVDGQFLYYERRLPVITVQLKADVTLSSIDDTIEAT